MKRKLMGLPGILVLTAEDRLIMQSHKMTPGGVGAAGFVAGEIIRKKDHGFDWALSEIMKVERGKHGVQKNVLEVTNTGGEVFRIIVKDYDEWEKLLKPV